MAVNVLDKINKKELKLGQPVDVAVKNIDDNFVLLFDAVDALEEAIPTKLATLKFGSKKYDGSTEQTITKGDIGLGNVENVLAIPASDRDKADGGVPTLDANGRVADSNKLGGKEASYYTNYKNITGTPTALKNPTALTVGSKTYDGSSAVEITKADLGLSSIEENTAYVRADKVGAKNGVASLDTNGKVPTAQLPSFVDDVLEYTNIGAFPRPGETGKIYVDISSGKTYRWSGTTHVEISSSLALGTTSSTAFPGDRGLALENRTINGNKWVDGNINLTLNEIKDGGGYVRVKNGGDVTISDGVITVNRVGGQTADQIGKVKDVKVNGVSKLDEEGVANISIDALHSGYANVTASASRTINNTLYYGFTVEKTDIEFEVYNSANQQILTQKVIDGDNLFVACSTTSGGTYTLRTILGSGVGGGGGGFVTTDMLNAIAVRLQPYTTQTTESFRLNSNEYTATGDSSYWGVNFTRTVNAPAYSKFTAVTVTEVGESKMTATITATISGDGKTATFSVDGGIKAYHVDSGSLPVTYEHTTTISF